MEVITPDSSEFYYPRFDEGTDQEVFERLLHYTVHGMPQVSLEAYLAQDRFKDIDVEIILMGFDFGKEYVSRTGSLEDDNNFLTARSLAEQANMPRSTGLFIQPEVAHHLELHQLAQRTFLNPTTGYYNTNKFALQAAYNASIYFDQGIQNPDDPDEFEADMVLVVVHGFDKQPRMIYPLQIYLDLFEVPSEIIYAGGSRFWRPSKQRWTGDPVSWLWHEQKGKADGMAEEGAIRREMRWMREAIERAKELRAWGASDKVVYGALLDLALKV